MNDSLEWTTSPAAQAVKSYNVYERTGPTTYKTPVPVTAPTVTYTPTNLAVGSHIFAVTAVNATGESPKSNEVTIVVAAPPPPPLPLPSAPTGLRVV